MSPIHKHSYLVTLLLSTLLLLPSCAKHQIPTYDAEHNAVRFSTSLLGEAPGYDHREEVYRTSYSFVATPFLESYDLSLPLVLVGVPANRDLEVRITVDEERSNAPQGSYEILSAKISAGTAQGEVLVRLFNRSELAEKDYELALHIVASDDLAPGPKEFTTAIFSWGKRLPAPPHSQLAQSYNMLIAGTDYYRDSSLDYYSPNALAVIVDALGWDDWDRPEVHGSQYNSATYFHYK